MAAPTYRLSLDVCRCNDRRCTRRMECLRHMATDPKGTMVWQAATFMHGDRCEAFIPLPDSAE